MDQSLVILLHGVGAHGAALAPLGEAWRDALPQTAFAAPDAPFPSLVGWQWYSHEGIDRDNRLARVVAARGPFDRLLRATIAAHGFGDRPERVALVGFSQGAIMALDALASGRQALAAVVAFSGRLASPPPLLSPARATPALLIHGEDDPIVPAGESRQAAQALQELGVETRLHILPGVDHCIAPAAALMARNFLSERFRFLDGAA